MLSLALCVGPPSAGNVRRLILYRRLLRLKILEVQGRTDVYAAAKSASESLVQHLDKVVGHAETHGEEHGIDNALHHADGEIGGLGQGGGR